VQTSANGNFSYSGCDYSATVNATGCETFTKSSDGSNAASQCGAFSISVNICAQIEPTCISDFGEFIIIKNSP